MKVKHLVRLKERDQLDVKRLEVNSINEWIFFLAKGGSCSYDDETIGDINVPLRYKHLVKQCVPKDIPPLNTIFCVNERIFRIAPSSLHGLGLFCMDGIRVGLLN